MKINRLELVKYIIVVRLFLDIRKNSRTEDSELKSNFYYPILLHSINS